MVIFVFMTSRLSNCKARGPTSNFSKIDVKGDENLLGTHNVRQFEIITILGMCDAITKSLVSKLSEMAIFHRFSVENQF